MNVLVIDNEPRWLEFLRQGLGKIFYVTAVSDVKQALFELQSKSFDLIIAGSRQLTSLEELHQLYPTVPIIVTTVQATSQEARTAYLIGVQRYLTKSFNMNALVSQIQEVLPLQPEMNGC